MRRTGESIVSRYDWGTVAQEIVRVYETTIAASHERVTEEPEAETRSVMANVINFAREIGLKRT
jgi:hypothetical protein